MEGSPFTTTPCSFDPSPFSSGFAVSPFGSAFSSSSMMPAFNNPSTATSFYSPFPSSSSCSPLLSSPTTPFNCTTTGRIRNRDSFEAQHQQQNINAQMNIFQQQQQNSLDDHLRNQDDLSWPSPMKKRKQNNMEIEKQGGEPNTSTREKRKRWGGDESPDNPNKVDRTQKQRKFIHKKPDAKDIPNARAVHVRFGPDILQTVEAKILYKEPWGVMVTLLEGREDLNAEKGRRYWTKFSGHVHPVTNVPILDAVHPC